MKFRDYIRKAVGHKLQELGIDSKVEVDRPKQKQNGEYSTNIALKTAKTLKKSPQEIGEMIVSLFKEDSKFEKVEYLNGFINFHLSKDSLEELVNEILKKEDEYGAIEVGKGKKATVEYVSANPTGPLHVGNARGGPIGDVLANVLEKAGYEVTREYLHNDVGGQVKVLGATINAIIKGIPLEENHYQGEYVNEIAEKLKKDIEGKTDEEIGQMAVAILFEEIIKDVELMGIKYDRIVKESDLKKEVPDVIEKLKGSVKEKDGALWFAPSDEFLKDRETVIRKTDGSFTYFASDIVYHERKFKEGNSLVIDVFGSNHSGHISRLKAVVNSLGYNPSNFHVILYQFVRIRKGSEIVKMSKRAGNFVTAREVLEEVGKDAFRFFILTQRSESHMDFDLDLAKKKASDNPVYYVQYAHARMSSLFKKADSQDVSALNKISLRDQEEVDLARCLIKLPETIEEISTSFSVNNLTTFALELSSHFHKFYEKKPILSASEEERKSKLALVKAAQLTLRNTLKLLGVNAPDRM